MRYLMMVEIIGLLLLGPVLRPAWVRRWLTPNRFGMICATYVSVLVATACLYYSTDPEGQIPPTGHGWVVASVLAISMWVFLYPFSRWVFRQLMKP